MLENQTSGHNTPQEKKTSKTEAAKKLEAQVAIYNEDDLSHLLYTGSNFETVTSHHNDQLHHHHHHHQQDGTLTPLTAPASSGTHTPIFSDHGDESDSESAVLEDWESPASGDVEVPRSPISRRRGGTMCSTDDDFEWPVFLGRQADELAASRRSSIASSTSSRMEDTKKRVPSEHHVESIEGPLMALWPASIDTLEFEAPFYE